MYCWVIAAILKLSMIFAKINNNSFVEFGCDRDKTWCDAVQRVKSILATINVRGMHQTAYDDGHSTRLVPSTARWVKRHVFLRPLLASMLNMMASQFNGGHLNLPRVISRLLSFHSTLDRLRTTCGCRVITLSPRPRWSHDVENLDFTPSYHLNRWSL